MEKQRKKRFCEKLKERKGFTLIEMVIVIAIIAILIALIAPKLTTFLGTARSTSLQANAKTTYTSMQAYVTDVYTKDGLSPVADSKLVITNGALPSGNNTIFGDAKDRTEEIKKFFDANELNGYIVAISFNVDGVVAVTCYKGTVAGEKATYPKSVTTAVTP